MKKIKIFLTSFLACVIASTMLVGCKDNKDSTPPVTETEIEYISKTYSNSIHSNASNVNHVSFEGENNFVSVESEDEIISVKLEKDGSAYLVYKLEAYVGTYTTDLEDDDKFYLTFADKENPATNYKIQMNAAESSAELVDVSETNKLIGSNKITLGFTEDLLFKNGLYLGLGSYNSNSGYDCMIENGAYTYKVSDTEIYTCDDATMAYKVEVSVLGNQLVYSVKYDLSGDEGEVNLFFIEKASEHDSEFATTYGDIDDAIYFVESESTGINRYYFYKVDESDVTLKVDNNITFTATKLFRTDYDNITYQHLNLDLELTINTNGSAVLTIEGNSKYNGTFNGKWYNIANGLLLTFDEKTTLFSKYLSIGAYDQTDEIVLSELIEDASTTIDYSGDVVFDIAWTETSHARISASRDWELVNSFIENN